jgi:hypothetical protein
MKYLMMFVDTEETAQRSQDESAQLSDKVMSWWGEHAASGQILGGEQLQGAGSRSWTAPSWSPRSTSPATA